MNYLHPFKLLLLGLVVSTWSLSPSILNAREFKQAGSIKASKTQKSEYSTMAKVSLQDAISAATKKVPGKAIEAELETENGYLVYEVKVMSADKKLTEVIVDAGTSAILSTEQESSNYFS